MEKPYTTYLFTYHHDGADWDLPIMAPSYEDACERLNKLTFARYIGEQLAIIPAGAGGGLLARLICWWRNRT